MTHPIRVEHLDPGDAEEVVSVIAEAFTGYPVVRYVLGPDQESRHRERLVRLFVMARVLRGEPLLGVRHQGELVGAGVVSFPGTPAPPEFLTLREDTWRLVGPEAEARYTAFGEATARFPFPAGCTHLNMLGARRAHQRRGLGRAILDAVQDIARARAGSPGVELTTEHLANVSYYEGLGFQVVGHAQVGHSPVDGGLESWGLFRPN